MLLPEPLTDPRLCTEQFGYYSGVSANADPHTNKLRTRVTHIWGYRRRQLNRSAMGEPLPGGTALLITVSPVPGKYDLGKLGSALRAEF